MSPHRPHPCSKAWQRVLPVAALLAAAILACSLGRDTQGIQGPGVFNPMQGLDSLPAYRATYRVAFEGTQAGVPAEWDETYVLSVLRDPAVRAMNAELTGEGDPMTGVPVFAAEMGNVLYWRDLPADACFSAFASTLPADPADLGARLPELAERLPRVSAWEPAGEPESVNGILAQPYTFDEEGLGAAGETEAQGQAWLAAEGDYVAQFHLVLQVEPSASGLNAEGTYTIDYTAAPIEASVDAVLPSDCRLPLPEMQHLGPASDMINLPGYLEFVVQATVPDAAAYYQQVIDQSGWALLEEPEISDTHARITFAAPGQSVDLRIDGGDSTIVSLIGHRSSAGTGAPSDGGQTGGSVEPTSVPSTVDPAVRVLDALNLLVDLDGEPALASYHLEVEHQAPIWEGTAVGSVSTILIADVQGADVHFTDQISQPDGSSSATEVYIVDDQEYVMQGGVPVQGFGMAALTWTMWPLDPLSILSAGASGATLEGTETIEGRPTEVYSIGGSGMPLPSIGGLGSLGIPVTAAEGTVWVDQATGALVRAVIDYEADVKDDGGTVRGQGSGHLEIHVTGIDATSVALPG